VDLAAATWPTESIHLEYFAADPMALACSGSIRDAMGSTLCEERQHRTGEIPSQFRASVRIAQSLGQVDHAALELLQYVRHISRGDP